MATRAGRRKAAEFVLHVPVDLSQVDGWTEGSIRLALQDEMGTRSEVVRIPKLGAATATFKLARRPKSVRVLAGPEHATEAELTGLQMIRVEVPSQQRRVSQEVRIQGLGIPARVIRSSFSKREAEILQLIAEGLTDKEVAARLGISKNTVATHIYRILARRGKRSRTAAVADWLGGLSTTYNEEVQT